MDIAERESRRLRDRILDQLRALRNPRHAEPRFVELGPCGMRSRRIATARGSTSIGTPKALAIESAVMSSWVGPIPPVVKHVVVAGTERVDRGDDVVLDVGDDPDLAEVDADIGQVFGDVADVLVLGPAGQDLVADDQDRCGDDRLVPCCDNCPLAVTGRPDAAPICASAKTAPAEFALISAQAVHGQENNAPRPDRPLRR